MGRSPELICALGGQTPSRERQTSQEQGEGGICELGFSAPSYYPSIHPAEVLEPEYAGGSPGEPELSDGDAGRSWDAFRWT
jgi:hypothetical protein